MAGTDRRLQMRKAARVTLVLLSGLGMMGTLSGCLLIGGSSRGGFFIFPGMGVIVLIVVVLLVLRRR